MLWPPAHAEVYNVAHAAMKYSISVALASKMLDTTVLTSWLIIVSPVFTSTLFDIHTLECAHQQ